MFKKILSILIPVLILLAIAFYIFNENKNNIELSPYNAIPNNAGLVIESKDFLSLGKEITQENDYWEDLISINSLLNINTTFLFIDSLTSQNQKIKKIIKSKPVIISVHNIGKSFYDIIFYINTAGQLNIKNINNYLLNTYNKSPLHKTYSNEDIYYITTTIGNTEKLLYFCLINNLFIASFSSILIEQSIRQLQIDNNILHNNYFTVVKQTAGKYNNANIYINLENFKKFISPLLNSKLISKSNIQNFGNWAEIDLAIKTNGLLLTGFSVSNDSTNNYLNIFKNLNPVSSKIENVIPSYIPAFLTFGFDNYSQYKSNYKKHLGITGKLDSHESKIQSTIKYFAEDPEKIMDEIFNNEVGILLKGNEDDDKIVVIKTKSQSIAKEKFIKLIKTEAKQKRKASKDYIFKYKLDNEFSFNIYKCPISNFAELTFGNLFNDIECFYFTYVNNYMFFADNKRTLFEIVRYNSLNKTLNNEPSYIEYSKYLSSQFNFYFYINVSKSKNILSNYLAGKTYSNFNKNFETLRKIQGLSYQFSSEDKMYYNNIFLNYSHDLEEKAQTIWESRLDTTLKFKPQLVINHYTQEKEIFIQDQNNMIYLINKSGRILWKSKLNEKIESSIFQVDYYKNNKLQLLFSTKNYIHLIDRNGENVEKYPIKLRSPSTSGINLFDYENNKDYRMFIACENKKVYAYNIKGNIVKGWGFNKSDNIITSPVQYFRAKNRDYIVFSDKYKTYILNRKGETRVKLDEYFQKSENNIFYSDFSNSTGSPRLVTTDAGGIIKYIYFDGKVSSVKIKKYTTNHFFNFEDINTDNLKDFIYVDGRKLEVYSQKSKRLIYDYSFDNELNHPPVCYYFGKNDIKIGIVNESINQILLFNSNGNIHNGFPLKGSTMFSIGKFNRTGRLNLVVGNEDMFLYNYKMQ